MKILFNCGYHPINTGFYLEKSFYQNNKVTYWGPPYDLERPDYSKSMYKKDVQLFKQLIGDKMVYVKE